MRKVSVSALQLQLSKDSRENRDKVADLCEKAATRGAQIILPPELFDSHYFCKEEHERFFELADEVSSHQGLKQFAQLSEKLGIVLPISFFEKKNQAYFNSVAILDRGEVLGVYRKSHIPDGPGYEEKFYFRPGDTGFKAWKTSFGTIGVGICWDQWFPECARAMCLKGAELLFYPTAIGSEPHDPELDTKDPWQRAMIGHAVSNATPVIAANRFGDEEGQVFYGHSFIADSRGDKIQEASSNEESILTATFDLDELKAYRNAFGFFRDRRPELYRSLLSADGFE